MKLVLISDTHEQHEKVILPEGDVLIHAGDYTYRGKAGAKKNFFDWFLSRPFKHKLFVAGNHDFNEPERSTYLGDGAHYLYDSEINLDGVTFWGSPYTPRFGPWAFMYDRPTPRWAQIPGYTDVLITHGPPFGVLDLPFGRGPSVGCEDLRERVELVQPKIHVFGHIHGSYGELGVGGMVFVNASVVNEAYEVVNPPVVKEI